MFRSERIFWSVILLWMYSATVMFAQNSTKDVGYTSSPKSFGVFYSTSNNNSRIANRIAINLDLFDVLNGQSEKPGVNIMYNMTKPFRDWELKSGTMVSFYAGPGVSIGYLKDFQKDFGWLMAVNGSCGFAFCFVKPVNIQLGIIGEFGIHYCGNNVKDTDIGLYKQGILNAIMPEISVSYRF